MIPRGEPGYQRLRMIPIGDAERLALLESHGRQFAAGATLYAAGDAAAEVFWLHEGRVRVVKRVRNVERNLAVVKAGDLFGEEALVEGASRAAHATALTDVVVVALSAAELASFVAGRPELAGFVLSQLARRTGEADEQLENAMLRDHPSRVINALLHFAPAAQADGEGLVLAVTPLELSSRAGLDVDAVKRVVQQLRDGSYVRIVDETVRIPDVDALRKLYDALGAKEEVRGVAS